MSGDTAYLGKDFPDGVPGESRDHTVDLTPDLADGESIVSTTWTVTVTSDSEAADPSPSALLDGAALPGAKTVGGDNVLSIQRLTGGLDNVTYLIVIDVATTINPSIKRWTYKTYRAPA